MRHSLLRLLAGVTFAATPLLPLAAADDLFQQLDKNSDGQLTKEEVDADKVRLFERLVRVGDKNADGKLDRAEFEAATKDRPAGDPAATPDIKPGEGRGPAEGRQGLAELLKRLDKNGDGKLSKEEAPERLQQNWDRLDRNGDGFISADEIPQSLPKPAEIFDRFDKNGDGKLSKDEAPERLQQNFERFDKNGDGTVDREELAAGFRAMAKIEGAPDGKPERKPAEGKPNSKPGRVEGVRKPDGDDTNRPNPERLAALFAALDTNRDGELTPEEVEAAWKQLRSLDKNGDGKLQKSELGR